MNACLSKCVRAVPFLAIVVMLGLGAVGLASAQVDPTAPRIVAPSLATQLERIRLGNVIRVETTGPVIYTGRLIDFDRVGMRLDREEGGGAEGSGSVTLALDEIRTLRVRGRATRTGAVIGGLAGVASGVLFGVWVAQIVAEGRDPDYGEVIPVTGLVFGAIGAGVGAIVGAAIPKWRLKWP